MKMILVTWLAVLMFASGASAYTVILQASDYIATHNAGGGEFYTTPCGGATNGLGVEGYDYPGDWIELKLVISQESGYLDSLRTAADDAALGDHILTVFDSGGVPLGQTSYFRTEGLGIG